MYKIRTKMYRVLLIHAEVRCAEPKASDSWTVIKFSDDSVGSSVEYSCEQGYELQGLTTRICQANGLWSGDASTCARKSHGGSEISLLPDYFYHRGQEYILKLSTNSECCALPSLEASLAVITGASYQTFLHCNG